MAKRAELWQVARGVLTSFASRNNDIDGYWGIGVLARLAQEQKRTELELSLRPLSPVAGDPVLTGVAARYADFLSSQLAKAGVPSAWLRAAELTFRFPADDAQLRSVPTSEIQRPFECHLTITDDRAETRSFAWSGWCWPHGAGPEVRSTRTALTSR